MRTTQVKGAALQALALGERQAWAIDTDGNVLFRTDITANAPAGSVQG